MTQNEVKLDINYLGNGLLLFQKISKMKKVTTNTIPLLLLVIIIGTCHSQWISVEKNEDSPCFSYKCPFGQRCVIINNQPICKCNHNCDKAENTGPLCTKSGRTYSNLCELKKAECKKGDYIMVDHFGKCKAKSKLILLFLCI